MPAPAPLPVTTWGTPRDLSTWSGPQVADLALAPRAAELRVLAAGARRAGTRALRELLALQSSDWAFLISRGTPARTRASAPPATGRRCAPRWPPATTGRSARWRPGCFRPGRPANLARSPYP